MINEEVSKQTRFHESLVHHFTSNHQNEYSLSDYILLSLERETLCSSLRNMLETIQSDGEVVGYIKGDCYRRLYWHAGRIGHWDFIEILEKEIFKTCLSAALVESFIKGLAVSSPDLENFGVLRKMMKKYRILRRPHCFALQKMHMYIIEYYSEYQDILIDDSVEWKDIKEIYPEHFDRKPLEYLGDTPDWKTLLKYHKSNRAALRKYLKKWDSKMEDDWFVTAPQMDVMELYMNDPEFSDIVAERLVACMESEHGEEIDWAFPWIFMKPERISPTGNSLIDLTRPLLWFTEEKQMPEKTVRRLYMMAKHDRCGDQEAFEAIEEVFRFDDPVLWKTAAGYLKKMQKTNMSLKIRNPERVQELIEKDSKYKPIFKGLV